MDEGINRYQTSPNFTPAEKIALRYADLMATDPEAIDAAFYDELRKYYSEEEIVELGVYIGFNIVYPMFSPDGRLVSQEESARLYGAAPVSLADAGAR
jgi:hypothetical protein